MCIRDRGYLFAFGDVVETAEFVGGLAEVGEHLGGFFAGNFNAFEALVFFDDLFHFGLDVLEVVDGEFVLEIEIVVEAGTGRWADIELGIWEEAEDGCGENVRRGVSDFFEGSHLFFHFIKLVLFFCPSRLAG